MEVEGPDRVDRVYVQQIISEAVNESNFCQYLFSFKRFFCTLHVQPAQNVEFSDFFLLVSRMYWLLPFSGSDLSDLWNSRQLLVVLLAREKKN